MIYVTIMQAFMIVSFILWLAGMSHRIVTGMAARWIAPVIAAIFTAICYIAPWK